MADQAVKLAIGSRWDEAVQLNREFVRLFPGDTEGYNRLGKALTELGQIREARTCYGQALAIEPTNQIARRNLDKLVTMPDSAAISGAQSQLDTRMFIGETGKAGATTLQAVDAARVAELDAGDLVELRLQGNAVNVHTKAGAYIGMVEPRIGLRLSKMMAGGNKYTAALLSTTGGEIRVMIRETYQHPSLIGRVSFPQARGTTEVRPYTRRGLLRGAVGEEIDYSEDDEPQEEESDEGWSETSEETEHGVGIPIETDDEESFD